MPDRPACRGPGLRGRPGAHRRQRAGVDGQRVRLPWRQLPRQGLVPPPLRHADLWARAARAWRRGRSEVGWVKAHLEWPEAQERGIPWHVWAGNQRADEPTGRGAPPHAPAAADVRRAPGARDDVQRAQRWMVEALRLASTAAPRPPRARRPKRSRKGRPGPRGPAAGAGEHGPIHVEGGAWVCTACSRRVGMTRPWREWRRTPCVLASRRSAPSAGPAAAAAEVPPGRVAHDLATAAGRTSCLRCGRSRLNRWRSQLGKLCPVGTAVSVALAPPPPPPPLPPPELPQPLEPGPPPQWPPGDPPPPPPPAPARRPPRRRKDAAVADRLASHSLRVEEGWLLCDRPGCGRRVRPRESSRLLACAGVGAPAAVGPSPAGGPGSEGIEGGDAAATGAEAAAAASGV